MADRANLNGEPPPERRRLAGGVSERRAQVRRRRAAVVMAIAAVAAAIAVVSTGPGDSGVGDKAKQAAPQPVRSIRLVAHRAGRLRQPLQDVAIAARGNSQLLLGGLDATDVSRAEVSELSGGRVRPVARLPQPAHDAAAAALGGSVFLFGGGQAASTDEIVELGGGGPARVVDHLPEARSDLGVAVVGGTAYLVGGYTGTQALATILAWRPGTKARVVGRLPQPLRYAAVTAIGGKVLVAGGSTATAASREVLSFDPTTGRTRVVGRLPRATTHAAAAALGGHAYVIGGRGAQPGTPTSAILAVNPASGRVQPAGHLPRPLSDIAAIAAGNGILVAGGRDASAPVADVTLLTPAPATAPRAPRPAALRLGPWLRRGSDPSVLPGNILIADKLNNRLLEIDPRGNTVWQFPRRGDLRRGETFLIPDDAFFDASGKHVIATQEDNFVISIIDVATHRIVYRYGTPGVPGSGPNQLNNPDDALFTPDGSIFTADIKNCRLLYIRPPAHRPTRQLGTTGQCVHDPPRSYGSPNGAFPMANGNTVVTEINGNWIDVINPAGRLVSAAHAPGYGYPSDTNEVRPGVFLTVDYSAPGGIQTFNSQGRARWSYAPQGAAALDHPSLALPLPNGDVLANDDYNDRVIVVDPRTNRVVWQYGHMNVPGSRPGYLNNPDGVDLAPPHALANRFELVPPR
jgi:outer membrane protein assembly factor BamB